MLIYSSPWLIAVSHVLLRLLMPRHSPYALCNLNLLFSYFALSFAISFYRFGCLFFYHPLVAKLQFLTFFLWKDQFLSFSIAFSISVRLLYSVFNDHLQSTKFASQILLVGLDGLEPSTSRLSGARSNHLSYRPWWR